MCKKAISSTNRFMIKMTDIYYILSTRVIAFPWGNAVTIEACKIATGNLSWSETITIYNFIIGGSSYTAWPNHQQSSFCWNQIKFALEQH